MPMVDYQCEECGYRWEEFHHSDPPKSARCPHVQDGPCLGYAPRVYSLPGEYRPTSAKRFDPIVLWVRDDNPDQISVPGDAQEPVDPGYHKVEITNLGQADFWARRINDIETRRGEACREGERLYWDQVARERRSDIRARIGSDPRAQALFRQVQEFVDRKRERRYRGRLDARAHFQVIAFDSSNRDGYRAPDTHWRNKRV